MKVAIVTPTIGSEYLNKCIESVQNQTYQNLTHYIFLDGQEHFENIHSAIQKKGDKKAIRTVELKENVGKGWCGHRVYAACSFLVNADVILYLDQDNWFDEEHVEKMIHKIESGYDWVYSFRKIVDKDGTFLYEDNCESLGEWPIFFNNQAFHMDTNCFALKRDVAVRVGHAWYDSARPMQADRQFFQVLKTHFKRFTGTKSYTVNYRLGGEQGVSSQFFEQGNKVNFEKYNGVFPWKSKEQITIGPGIILQA